MSDYNFDNINKDKTEIINKLKEDNEKLNKKLEKYEIEIQSKQKKINSLENKIILYEKSTKLDYYKICNLINNQEKLNYRFNENKNCFI